ncbi:MAG: hypothetical protein ACI9VI_002206 [Candidatus Azotimanducaceae bacterium]
MELTAETLPLPMVASCLWGRQALARQKTAGTQISDSFIFPIWLIKMLPLSER